MSAASLRKGWCPGASRPMMTGDGLLLRIRLAAGRLSLDRAEAIADCAESFGNGIIEISSRANLQLRGVGEAGLADLQRRLGALGLLDEEGARNILASPIADLDPNAIVDVAPVAAALAEAPASAAGLPAKFSFLIDGGGALPLGDIDADIRFEALSGHDGPFFAITLGGDDHVAAQCAPADVAGAAHALTLVFQREAGKRAMRRMKALVAQCGAASLFAAADLPFSTPLAPLRRRAAPRDFLGAHALGASTCVGAAPQFGRTTGADLRLLTRQARRRAGADIRITPWRMLLVTGLDQNRGAELAASLAAQGFILDPADPRLAIVACSGAPACANAARPVQDEALEFAACLPASDGIVLHVSGCEKGCAHARTAPFALVARKAGYDLVVNGEASDPPSRKGLSVAEVASLLTREFRVHQR